MSPPLLAPQPTTLPPLLQVIDSTAALKRAQLAEDSPSDLATIPRVAIADLERAVKTVHTEMSTLGPVPLLTHPLPCAGVVYADVLLDLSRLPLSEIPLLSLFTGLMSQTGTSDMDATTLQRRIGARTGGISVSTMVEQPIGPDGGVGPADQV
jgi:hypothetical protein